VLVGASHDDRACTVAGVDGRARGSRELQYLVVVELRLEVPAVGEEVEELERGLLWARDAVLEVVVENLFEGNTLAS